jgi:hypothetical protein
VAFFSRRDRARFGINVRLRKLALCTISQGFSHAGGSGYTFTFVVEPLGIEVEIVASVGSPGSFTIENVPDDAYLIEELALQGWALSSMAAFNQVSDPVGNVSGSEIEFEIAQTDIITIVFSNTCLDAAACNSSTNVPEPGTLGLLGVGLLALLPRRRKA